MAKIDLREHEFFERFIGPDHVDSNDVQFWYQLLSCSFDFTRVRDPKSVDRTLSPFIDVLALNNLQSLNLGSLIRVTLDRVSRIKSKGSQSTNPYYVFQSFNAIYLIRTICKNFIENSSEDMLIQAFRAKVDLAQPTTQKQAASITPPQHLKNTNHHSQQDAGNAQHMSSLPNGQMPTRSQVQSTSQAALPTENISEPQIREQSILKDSETANQSGMSQVDQTHQVGQEQSKKDEVTPGTTMLDQFISTLIEIIVDMPLNDSTYLLQVEAINALLVLLSIQMYSSNRANQFYIFRTLMQKKCSIHALVLTKTLLNNFIRQDPVPQENGSIILDLASGLWKVLTLGYGQEDDEQDTMPYLARQSLLLLNVLTNHYTTGKNPYREAIIHCQDSKFNPSDPQTAFDMANNDALATASTSKSVLASNNIKIDFGHLFETICKHLQNDQVALLLYLLLHSNKIFKPYVLTTVAHKLDQLVLPLLKILYSSIQKGSHHIYMVLIIFVILSEDASFSDSIHKIIVKGIPWFKDRMINEISLGSFTVLIVIRSFQYNTLRVKDKFLHTNLFATLGNLSNYVEHLHPYVCQRLIDLLERLTKRYLAISKPISKARAIQASFDISNPLAKALATDTQNQEFTQDSSAIELDSSATQNQSNIPATVPYHNGSTGDGSNAINIIIPNQQPFTNNGMFPAVDIHGQELTVSSGQDSGQQSPGNNSQSEQVNISMEDPKIDLAWLEEIIRMILEVINNLTESQLDKNPDLIYTLLYKRSVFKLLLSSHQSFYNMVINVERILTFFYNKIESYQRQLTVDEIKELIGNSSKDWSSSQAPADLNSQLMFRYVEDDQPEDFFIPYMWTKIYYSSGIAWNPKRIVLFNPEIA